MPVSDLRGHRAISPIFDVTFPTGDNLLTINNGYPVSGIFDSLVADGYYLMLEPLSPGTHVINFAARSTVGFALNVTDVITVVPIPLSERVQKLISVVEESSLSRHRKHRWIEELKEAGKDSERHHVRGGIEDLREFQKKVRHEIAENDPVLAQQLIKAAQTIIEKARRVMPVDLD